MLAIAPLGPADEPVWNSILATSPNATLFHDLAFLRYHPPGRHRFHHLIARRDGKPVALIPGGLTGDADRPFFTSPVGASIGGPALAPGVHAELARAIVVALQAHTREQGWAGVEFVLPPAIYHPAFADLVSFSLFCAGFRLVHRHLCHVLALTDGDGELFERSFLKRQIGPVRAARRRGVKILECGLDGLERFLQVFDDTYRRHGVTATHSADEIADLLGRFPDRIRIHLAMLDDAPIGGILVLRLTPRVATTFYLCSSTAHVNEHGVAAAMADLMERLRADGCEHLDLGPSASDLNFNGGVVFFKEALGGVGHCRDRWRWTVSA